MFIDQNGLTNSKPYEQGAENGLLWTLQHILLEGSQRARIHSLMKAIDNCRVDKGIYAQNPAYVIEGSIKQDSIKDAYMSPDQLIVIMMASYVYGSKHHKDIGLEILKQGGFRYNNLRNKELRLIHPRDLVLYISMVIPILGNLLLPLLVLASVIACLNKREVTSGKLLAWTKCMMLKDHFIVMKIGMKLCTMAIKRNHPDWADVFEIYFPNPSHPSRKLAQKRYR